MTGILETLKRSLLVFTRHFRRSPGLSLLSMLAMALGLACWLLTWIYIGDERSYDGYHRDLDRLYRVGVTFRNEAGTKSFALVAVPVGPALKETFPEVQYMARVTVSNENRRLVRYGERAFFEEQVVRAEPDLLNILAIDFVRGDPRTALQRPNTVAVTQAAASRYFGNQDPLGKTLRIDDQEMEVTGILADAPANTHLKYRFIVSLKDYPFKYTDQWRMTTIYTYIKLAAGVDAAAFARKMRDLTDRYSPPRPGFTNPDLSIMPVKDIHLCSHLSFEIETPGNPAYLRVALILGWLILITAAMNFANLLIALSGTRAREVGVRKVLGAERRQLTGQFILEAQASSWLGLLLAGLLTLLALPLANSLLDKTYSAARLLRPGTVLAALAVTVLTGLAAGIYPAVIFSRFSSDRMLKGTRAGLAQKAGARRLLLLFQFAISIALIIATLSIGRQIAYMKNRPLGFAKTQQLVLPVRAWPGIAAKAGLLQNEFGRLAAVNGTTFTSSLPGREMSTFGTRLLEEDWNRSRVFRYLFCDFAFIDRYRIGLAAGRPFRRDMGSDSASACLVNRAAVRALGLASPAAALGRTLVGGNGANRMQIIGVSEDFHYRGLQAEVEPLVMELLTSPFGRDFSRHEFLTLGVETARVREALAAVKATWRRLNPQLPFEYFFLDNDFNLQYRAEERIGKLSGALTVIGIAIACLGLLGMMIFSAQRRRKEMAIRKVVGASVAQIAARLNREFFWLLLAANLLAWPLAYFAVDNWLQGFANRAAINPLLFVVAALSALLLAMLTVSLQTLRAARANPVDSLRCE
jgi:putative ABC transport system permease protein